MNKTDSLDPMNRAPMKNTPEMVESMKRVSELYPEDINFAVSGAIGNERQYSESMEWK